MANWGQLHVKVVLFAILFRWMSGLFEQQSARNAAISIERRNRLANLRVSLVHSIIAGVWAVALFLRYPDMWANMSDWYEPAAHYLVSTLLWKNVSRKTVVKIIYSQTSGTRNPLLLKEHDHRRRGEREISV